MQGRARRRYRGQLFASALHARWAALWDLCRWDWWYQRETRHDVTPDFLLSIPGRDYVRAHVLPRRSVEDALSEARTLFRPFYGPIMVLGARPTPDLGTVALFPNGKWRRIKLAEFGIATSAAELWRQAETSPEREACCSPADFSGEIIPDWRSRGEAFARRWSESEGQITDWGLVIARLAEVDMLVAGALAGAAMVRMTETAIEVWMEAPSVRASLLETLGTRAHAAVQAALELPLVLNASSMADQSRRQGIDDDNQRTLG